MDLTNDRVTSATAVQWKYCPWCGNPLEQDQNRNLLVWDDEGINFHASEKNGYKFNESLQHCGFHIRIWAPTSGESEIE